MSSRSVGKRELDPFVRRVALIGPIKDASYLGLLFFDRWSVAKYGKCHNWIGLVSRFQHLETQGLPLNDECGLRGYSLERSLVTHFT